MPRKPNLFERVGLALADGYLREAAGESIDPDDHLYRRVTDTRRDLTPVAHDRAQSISLHLWRTNPMAKRVIEMLVDFTVGADGLQIEAENDAVQRVIDDFWGDPVMGLSEGRDRTLARDWSINGELAFRRFSNETSKRMRLGYLDPSRIDDIIPDPDNVFVDRTLMLRRPGRVEGPEPVALIRWVDGEEATAAALDPAGQWVGDAFYFAINRVTGQHRGTPDLLAMADWVDGYDQLLFNALERSGLINAFVYDVTLTGADELGIEDWLQKNGAPPPPGSVRVHNEKEVWDAVAPNLNGADVMAIGRPIKNMALGGAGMPEAWFAEGDSANRATLAAQGDPTYRMLASRQRETESMFKRILTVAVQDSFGGTIPTDADTSFRITMPELSAKDTSSIAAALPQVTTALVSAIAEELIDKQNGRAIFVSVAGQLGVDLDIAQIEENIEAESAEREAEEEERQRELAAVATGLEAPEGENGPQRPPTGRTAPVA